MNSPTLALEPSQQGERVMTQWHSSLSSVKHMLRNLKELDIAGNLMFLVKHRYSKVVFHVRANKICLPHSEIIKSNIVEVCKLPIPIWPHPNVFYSRL